MLVALRGAYMCRVAMTHSAVRELAFHDGLEGVLVSSAEDSRVKIWNVDAGACLWTVTVSLSAAIHRTVLGRDFCLLRGHIFFAAGGRFHRLDVRAAARRSTAATESHKRGQRGRGVGTSERKVEEAPRVDSRVDMDVVEVGEKFYRRHGAVSTLDSWASERMDLLAVGFDSGDVVLFHVTDVVEPMWRWTIERSAYRENPVVSVHISGTGSKVVACGKSSCAIVWSVKSGDMIRRLVPPRSWQLSKPPRSRIMAVGFVSQATSEGTHGGGDAGCWGHTAHCVTPGSWCSLRVAWSCLISGTALSRSQRWMWFLVPRQRLCGRQPQRHHSSGASRYIQTFSWLTHTTSLIACMHGSP